MKSKSNNPDQKGKPKGAKIFTIKQKEKKIPLKDIKKSVNEGGLKLSWIKFIDEFIANGGKQAEAYKKVYGTKENPIKDSTASSCSSKLLRNANILKELNNKLEVEKCTEGFIQESLIDIATTYRGAKTINAAVKSLEILAKMKGLLIDTKKIAFDDNNPAKFLSPYSEKEKESFEKIKTNKERLVE